MSLINIQRCNFLEKLVQCLIAMCYEKCTLLGEVMVEIANDLCSYIGLSSARGAYYDCKTWVGARHDCFHCCSIRSAQLREDE